MDLTQLQNLIKRDPSAYKDDFLVQQRHFLSQLQIFQLKPTDEHTEFSKLVSFISHVRFLYIYITFHLRNNQIQPFFPRHFFELSGPQSRNEDAQYIFSNDMLYFRLLHAIPRTFRTSRRKSRLC
jgi:hypothetical protein